MTRVKDWARFTSKAREKYISVTQRVTEHHLTLPQFRFNDPSNINSEEVLGSSVEMALECRVESACVLAELRVVNEDGSESRRKGALFVLQDVESQACENEISDGKIITDDELASANFSKLLLTNGKELGKQSSFEGLDGSRLLFIRGEDKDLATGIEQVAPSVDDHVNDASLLPVVVGVVAMLDTERAEDCKGLLLALATACSDG